MMRTIAVLALALLCLAPASASKRDPLTDKEADQIREASMEPEKRLPLFVREGAHVIALDVTLPGH